MAKFDYKKNLKELCFPPSDRVVLVDVPEMNFLMVGGAGDPNSAEGFQDAIQVL